MTMEACLGLSFCDKFLLQSDFSKIGLFSIIYFRKIMRIAFIGQKGIPAKSGGVERHVEEISTRMAKSGHNVTVYVRSSYDSKRKKFFKGIRLIHIPSVATKNLDAITYTILATLHALFCCYDVLHYQAIGPSSLSWMPRFFKRRTIIVATFHSRDYEHQKWGWFAKLYLKFGEWITCNAPHATIVIGKSIARYVYKSHGKKTIYIPNGSSILPTKSSRTLSRWGLRKKRYILSVSRLVKHKGLHFLIEAFKLLEDTNRLPNNFKLVIVGDHSKTKEYSQYLKFISRGRKNIIFTGERTGMALRELYSHAYMFVQPSFSEGLSIALLEAMSCSIATLVSDIPENIEAVENAGTSFHVGNKDDLVKKMAMLLNCPEEVDKLGIMSRERIRREYSWDSVALNTVHVYETVLRLQGSKSFFSSKAGNMSIKSAR